MIPEEMLFAAAKESCIIYTSQVISGYDEGNPHIFSLNFEKKIKKLKRRADHPIYYETMHRVASAVLAILIAGSLWIVIDADARAVVVGWVKDIYETYFVYRLEENKSPAASSTDYRPTLIPDGYTEFFSDSSKDTVSVVYANEKGEMLKFDYAQNSDDISWFVGIEQMVVEELTINGIDADLVTSETPGAASAIMWIADNNTAFCVSGFLTVEELIAVAKSVQPIND